MVNKNYQSHKEKIPKEAREKYQSFSEEEKVKRRKKAQERLQKWSQCYQERKQKLPEYRRNYYLKHKK